MDNSEVRVINPAGFSVEGWTGASRKESQKRWCIFFILKKKKNVSGGGRLSQPLLRSSLIQIPKENTRTKLESMGCCFHWKTVEYSFSQKLCLSLRAQEASSGLEYKTLKMHPSWTSAWLSYIQLPVISQQADWENADGVTNTLNRQVHWHIGRKQTLLTSQTGNALSFWNNLNVQ